MREHVAKRRNKRIRPLRPMDQQHRFAAQSSRTIGRHKSDHRSR
jgi:hypothetical protein